MAKTTNLRLSGWVINSNIFNEDMRMIDLLESRGALGFLTYVVVRGLISRTNGYYAELNKELILACHRELGKCSRGQAYIKETILYFGTIGILDSESLKNNILTSLDIQEEWLRAKISKRAKIDNYNLEHWLLVDTLPTPTDTKCSNNGDKCSNYSDNCYNNANNCGLDKTTHEVTGKLVLKNTNKESNSACGNTCNKNNEIYSKETVLDILYSKQSNFKTILNKQPYSENAILYADYWANACNDDRYMSYTIGTEKVKLNKDFFITCLFEISSFSTLRAFEECYNRQKDIRQSVEWYFRGVLVHQHTMLAKDFQNKFQRGEK